MEARGKPSNDDKSAGNPGVGIWDNPMYQGFDMEAAMKLLGLEEAQEKAEREWNERNDG